MNETELLAQARKLRDLGYAVILLSAEELEGLHARDVEDELMTFFSDIPKPEAP